MYNRKLAEYFNHKLLVAQGLNINKKLSSAQ